MLGAREAMSRSYGIAVALLAASAMAAAAQTVRYGNPSGCAGTPNAAPYLLYDGKRLVTAAGWACDVTPALLGVCSNINAGQPHGPFRGTCGGTGACQGVCEGKSNQCHFPGSETVCGCAGPLVPLTGTCDSAGQCSMLGLPICL